ncbi:MAG: hypothetical protein IPL55_23880 [Saprospiraceae bacterium]|jgi:hypothetical protein|nr:hypothetical protein [Saprospiraceae bacterium]MBL0026788.1 hypothetical protein [Saprospiraceae bacterium]
MKKSFILGLFVVIALASCKNTTEAPAETPAVEATATETPAVDTTAAAMPVDTTSQQ